jgi:hypothetical protein
VKKIISSCFLDECVLVVACAHDAAYGNTAILHVLEYLISFRRENKKVSIITLMYVQHFTRKEDTSVESRRPNNQNYPKALPHKLSVFAQASLVHPVYLGGIRQKGRILYFRVRPFRVVSPLYTHLFYGLRQTQQSAGWPYSTNFVLRNSVATKVNRKLQIQSFHVRPSIFLRNLDAS